MPTVTKGQLGFYFFAFASFVGVDLGVTSLTPSLRTLCPLKDACILVAALFKSGSDRSMSSSSDSCKNSNKN